MTYSRLKMFNLILNFIDGEHIKKLNDGHYDLYQMKFSKFYIMSMCHPASSEKRYQISISKNRWFSPLIICKNKVVTFKYNYTRIGVIKFINQCSIFIDMTEGEFISEIQSKLIELI